MYHAEDMYPEEGSYRDKEEGCKETSAKLSATHVIRKDTSVAIVLSIHGTNKAKDEKP